MTVRDMILILESYDPNAEIYFDEEDEEIIICVEDTKMN